LKRTQSFLVAVVQIVYYLIFANFYKTEYTLIMSVIQSIRDKATWIISASIGLALIAFIAQDGTSRGGSMFANTTTIGKVNGVKIEKKEFDEKVEMVRLMNGGQGQQEQIASSVWNMMVQQTLLDQVYEKLGFVMTGKELSDILFGANPPQWLQQAFVDPNTGQFNMEQAKQQFAQMKKNANNPQVAAVVESYINPTIQQTQAQKYQTLITQAIYTPKWVAEKMNADNNAIANISYVYVPYTSIVDSTIQVTDTDVEAYVSKHKAEFEKENETRSISYITFQASPTSADSAVIYNGLNEIKPAFETTTDAKAFVASKGSEINYLDGFVTSSNLKVPNAEIIKTLPVNAVFGPYVDGQNFTIAKMIAKRSMPDSAKCRHILIKTEDAGKPVLSDSVASKRIDSIKAAIAAGADFNLMVQKYTDDPSSKAKAGEYEFTSTQFASISKEFAETIFYGNTGDKKVVKVANAQYAGYHYIEVLSQKKVEEAYKIAYVSKPIVPSNETVTSANDAANKFVVETKSKESFEANAKKLNKIVMPAAELQQNDFAINGLGNNRSLIRWIYENKVGTVSEPQEFGDKIAVAVITNISKAGVMDAAAAKPLTEIFIRNEKKAQQIIETKFKGNTLEAYAQAAATTVMRADSISFQAGFIPAVGNEPKIVGAAFNKNITGKTSTPIAGTTGVFAVKGEAIGARPAMGGSIDEQRKAIESNIRTQVGYRALDALRKSAKVDDNRATFY